MYRNAPMTRDTALDIATNAGLELSNYDEHGKAIAGTARVRIVPNGEGYDAILPVESLVKIANVNFAFGRQHAKDNPPVEQ